MKVLKFGGSSVKSAESIQKVINIVASVSKESKVFVIVSAFGKTTNKLIQAAKLAENKDVAYKEVLNASKALVLLLKKHSMN